MVRLLFMTKEQLRNDYNLLHVALGDSRQLSVAYPILARHGLMERTTHGYKSIDPDAVVRRARELIDRIADDVIQSIEPNDKDQPRPAPGSAEGGD